jgi:hypothetical protein
LTAQLFRAERMMADNFHLREFEQLAFGNIVQRDRLRDTEHVSGFQTDILDFHHEVAAILK